MELKRGDSFSFDFGAEYENGETYIFQVGDIVKIGVKSRETQSMYELFKKIEVNRVTDTLTAVFDHKETKKLGIGNKTLEIELTEKDGAVRTIYQGKITVEGDVINE